MNKEELIDLFFSEYCDGICFDDLQAFAKLVAEKERREILGLADSLGWVNIDHIQSRGQE